MRAWPRGCDVFRASSEAVAVACAARLLVPVELLRVGLAALKARRRAVGDHVRHRHDTLPRLASAPVPLAVKLDRSTGNETLGGEGRRLARPPRTGAALLVHSPTSLARSRAARGSQSSCGGHRGCCLAILCAALGAAARCPLQPTAFSVVPPLLLSAARPLPPPPPCGRRPHASPPSPAASSSSSSPSPPASAPAPAPALATPAAGYTGFLANVRYPV